MWASTRCPLDSSTRNIALGRGSTTRPSTSMAPSFLGMSSANYSAWSVRSRHSQLEGAQLTCGHSTEQGGANADTPVYAGAPWTAKSGLPAALGTAPGERPGDRQHE